MLFKLKGMSVQNITLDHPPINLRQQAHYWRMQHARAVKREVAWKEKALQLGAQTKEQAAKIAEQGRQIDALKAKIVWLQQQVFGRKSEQSADTDADTNDAGQSTDSSGEPPVENGRKRGKQPGAKGHGRKRRVHLPTEEVSIDLAKHEQHCPTCRKAFKRFPGTEDSDEIHWQGATLFVDHPEVPMDNNESERRLRNPVIGRKNYYGSGALWSGSLAAMMFTIFQTLLLNHIDPQTFLLAYFEACAQNCGCVPENINEFLPWNLPEQKKILWRYPKQPP